MRGENEKQLGLLSVINLEARVRKDHPLPRIKPWADRALGELSPVSAASLDQGRLKFVEGVGCDPAQPVEVPRRCTRFFGGFTFNPTSRRSRCTWFLLTVQPSRRNSVTIRQ